MKKLITLFVMLIIICTTFTVFASADESLPAEGEANTTQGPEFSTQTNGNEIYDKLIGYISNGEIWVKIGVTAVSVLALILAIKKSLAKITDALHVLKGFIEGKASKEDAEKAIKSAVDEVKAESKIQYERLSQQYDDLCTRNNDLEAILSLVALQLIKSPNARTEIMALISKTKEHSGSVAEIVEAIELEIQRADELTKDKTPALDSIAAKNNISLG